MSDETPIVRWTPEEVWVIAELARRLLVARIDGGHVSSSENGVFRASVRASAEAIDLALVIDAERAALSLAARDPAGQRWRDGWSLEIERGDERWILEPGGAVEIADARRAPLTAHLRVRRRCVVADTAADNVPLVDAAFHRYTRQSSIVDEKPPVVVPWMTPTREEAAPWWEIDLGKPMYIAWLRIDLGALPPGTRITCHVFGHHAPSGEPPAGSVVAEIEGDALHVVDGHTFFTIGEARVARHVRAQAHAPAGGTVSLAISAAEIQAADLHGDSLRATMRRAFVLHDERTLCVVRPDDGAAYQPASSYGDMWVRAMALSRGLAARLEPSDERIVVAVVMRNRPEWIATDLAILERGYVSISLAPDDPDERLAQILAIAKPTCVVVEAPNADRLAHLATTATLFVVLDATPTAANHVAFDTLVADDAPSPQSRSQDDLYAVLFTSGSTGTPKGAMRTYRTFHEMISSYGIGHSPRHLSFQPLSHLSERMYLPAVLINGGTIAFSRGGAHLLDELAALEPTSIGSVPRLYEVLHAAYARRVAAAPADEAKILAETRAMFGERLLAVSVGSAPCSAEVLAFLRRCFADVWVSEGYGTTELGTIAFDGRVAEHVEVKLVPLPDTTDETRGEIWVRTPHVIAGYLGDATTTVDADGFVATGDLGHRDAGGRVHVIGRVRNTIKLAQGEFVSIDRVEAILASAPIVDRIFVHAGFGSSHLAAVVIPRTEAPAWVVADELRAHARQSGLAPYEVPVDILLETEPFTVENGLLTASGKLARAALIAKYGARLGPATRSTVRDLPQTGEVVGARIARIATEIAKRPVALDEPLGSGIGVDSLAAAEILAAISDELDREVPLGWWFESRTLADLAARIVAAPSGASANRELALADLDLPTPKVGTSRVEAPATRAAMSPRRVLLTGATGFLGSHLVAALRARDIEVVCLVRARDDAAAAQRLADALAKRELAVKADAIAGDLARGQDIDPPRDTGAPRDVDASRDADVRRDGSRDTDPPRDVGVPGIDIDGSRGIDVPFDIDAVVHAGAAVSWLASYDALRAPNVHGTLAMLELAAKRGVPFHHVSTISTAPPDGDEASVLAFDDVVGSTPYALSKWVAEQHARRAGDGVAIYRPAMIAGDTRTGIGNAEDFLNRYLAGCMELGLYIDRDDAVVDMTPVDFVANAIAACVARGKTGHTMHLANVDQSLTYAAVGRSMVDAGVAVTPATYEEFRAALLAHRASRLHPLAAFFPERFSLAMGPWPCACSLATLAELGVARPRIDAGLIARYVSRLAR